MLPIAVARAMLTPEGFDNVTVKVSSGSTVVSPRMSTWICWVVTPGAKEMLPAAAV